MISASHNPFEDNGIKVFSGRGEKFTERVEREVEAIVADPSWTRRAGEPAARRRTPISSAPTSIICARSSRKRRRSRGFTLAIDCANGATTTVAPRAVRQPRASTSIVIGDQPDGRNINLRLRVDASRAARARPSSSAGCQMGVAFDGDGDRAIFVDHRGEVVNGDAVLLMCARQLQREGRLKGDAIVATVMSNIGLELALRELGIDLVRTRGRRQVRDGGDAARGLSLGGEQSGHIIFSDYLFTGDGLCTALNVLRTIALTGRTLADLAADLVTYPQVLLNVRVREKVDLQTRARGRRSRSRASKRASPARAGCSSAIPAPSRCCA